MPQSPQMQQPQRIPLLIEPENRNNTTSFDARLRNCYVERDKLSKEIYLYRRPGRSFWLSPPAAAVAGCGVYWWNGNVYSIFGSVLYQNGTAVATGLDTTGGVYSFNSIMGATPKLTMNNGAKSYSYNVASGLSADWHTIDPTFPQYNCKGLAYLDGGTYVLQHFYGTSVTPATIWGSAVDSVDTSSSWDPLDFITAQTSPDSGVYITRQGPYVIALKEWSTEFFFDAGNATGSPLAPAQNLRIPFGCASADSVQSINDVLFWLANSREQSYQVIMVDSGQMKIVSTPAIDRLLRDFDLTTIYSWHIKIDGHTFYVLTSVVSNLTLVYDIGSDMWSQWSDANGNYVPIIACTRDSFGHVILQGATDGNLYYASTDYLTDNGAVINIAIITPRWDGGTLRNKHLGMMMFVADISPGSSMGVQCSDDDYQTYTPVRQVNLGTPYPMLTNCGTFRRRAWKFTVQNALPWRLSAVELQFDIGTL